MRANPPCPNVKVPWLKLGYNVWDTFVQCITGLDALELVVKDKRRVWKAQKANIERQIKGIQGQVNRLQKKRRLYSWQQVEGIITEDDLLIVHRQLKSEKNILNDQLHRLEEFRGEPTPPDWARFKKLAEYWAGAIACELDYAPDDMRARFVELFDLYVTIHPNSSGNGYHFDMSANIPLEMEGAKPGAYDIVFSSPRGGLRG